MITINSNSMSLPTAPRRAPILSEEAVGEVHQDQFTPSAAPAQKVDFHPSHGTGILLGTLQVNGAEHGPMEAGKPAQLAFSFRNEKTGESVSKFELEHEKPMHLIVVSQDLETFAHLHPQPNGEGTFVVDVNQASSDPDNLDAARAISKGGPNFLYAELRPQGQAASERLAFQVKAAGAVEPKALVPDVVGSGEVTRYFDAQGKPGSEGSPYRVTLGVDDMRPSMVHFNFHLQAAEQVDGKVVYSDVHDAENWLGMAGHGIMIGAEGQKPQDRYFSHLHSGHGHGGHVASNPTRLSMEEAPVGAGPDFMFMQHGEMPPDGVYKFWGQFHRHDEILTFPFVVKLGDQ